MINAPSQEGHLPAQKAFQELLTRWIAPLMKAHGFSRKGPSFYLREHDNCGVVNVQKSTSSTAEKVRFTVNLGVSSRRVRSFLSPQSSDAVPSVWDCTWRERIGFLLRGRRDVWWDIDATTSLDQLGPTMRELLRDAAIPAIKHHLPDEALRDLWMTGRSPGATEIQRLLCLTILLKDLGPNDRLPAVVDELRGKAAGKPAAAMVDVYLAKLLVS